MEFFLLYFSIDVVLGQCMGINAHDKLCDVLKELIKMFQTSKTTFIFCKKIF